MTDSTFTLWTLWFILVLMFFFGLFGIYRWKGKKETEIPTQQVQIPRFMCLYFEPKCLPYLLFNLELYRCFSCLFVVFSWISNGNIRTNLDIKNELLKIIKCLLVFYLCSLIVNGIQKIGAERIWNDSKWHRYTRHLFGTLPGLGLDYHRIGADKRRSKFRQGILLLRYT